MIDFLHWLKTTLPLQQCDSTQSIYDHMESQSGRWLPIIYQPFDINKRSHWADRGAIWDFYHTVGDGAILDFGPGDGWPALLLAPLVDRVVGVDASLRRVAVCRENAQKLTLTNAEFHNVKAGEKLPFADNSFDGVTAASAIEQTPDPQATIRELHRVLKPGGSMRVTYESLNRYRGGREKEIDSWMLSDEESLLLVYDRHPDDEVAFQYVLLTDLNQAQLGEVLQQQLPIYGELEFNEDALQELRRHVKKASTCRLYHPSGATLVRWLKEAEFGVVMPTENGCEFAAGLYDEMRPEKRPATLDALDDLLRVEVADVIHRAASPEDDPWITAIK